MARDGTAKSRKCQNQLKIKIGYTALEWIHKNGGDVDVRSIRSRRFEDGVSAAWVIVDK